jgi:hypothetical protein
LSFIHEDKMKILKKAKKNFSCWIYLKIFP